MLITATWMQITATFDADYSYFWMQITAAFDADYSYFWTHISAMMQITATLPKAQKYKSSKAPKLRSYLYFRSLLYKAAPFFLQL